MVEFITFQKKKYPIRVSYYVLMMAQKESGLAIDELDKDFGAQQSILWYALEAGHKVANKKLELNRDDIVWILDECYLEFQKAMFEFAKSLVDIQTEAFADASSKGKTKKK